MVFRNFHVWHNTVNPTLAPEKIIPCQNFNLCLSIMPRVKYFCFFMPQQISFSAFWLRASKFLLDVSWEPERPQKLHAWLQWMDVLQDLVNNNGPIWWEKEGKPLLLFPQNPFFCHFCGYLMQASFLIYLSQDAHDSHDNLESDLKKTGLAIS